MYNEMYYEENYNDTNDVIGEQNQELNKFLTHDRGLNYIKRKIFSEKNGRLKDKTIKIYTSGGVGCRIRDAESGKYYTNIVGSKDESLFFKINLSTNECNSKNGSNTLFYSSPQHFMNHQNHEVDRETISKWESKRDNRLKEIMIQTKSKKIDVN
jgi:hypothetical protein